MIQKIDIKRFGLFNDFLWTEKIGKDKGNNQIFFEKENIIYGRNYSGKTTLSRILRALETKIISEKYGDISFEIQVDKRNKIDSNNYKDSSLKVRVFNEDFVRENLSFISFPDGNIKSFAILGDNTDIQPQIDKLVQELGSNEKDNETGLYKNLRDLSDSEARKKSEWEKLSRKLTDELTNEARKIKNENSKYGNVNYNITSINNDVNFVKSSDFLPISDEKEILNKQTIKEEAKAEVRFSLFNDFKFDEFERRAKELLSKNILDSNKIEELVKNSYLNNWVKEGYDLHKYNRQDCKCGFCGNQISESRWQELDKHFDKETEQLKQNLNHLKEEILNEINKIPLLPEKNIFYSEFHSDAEKILKELEETYESYKVDLQNIINKIEEREKDILKVLNPNFEQTFQIDNFNNLNQRFAELVKENNNNSQQLSKKQEEAKKELRLMEVYRFLDRIGYDNQKQNISRV